MESDEVAKTRYGRVCHDTVLVAVGERSAQIDVQLARIIESLWKLGIDTRACCQDETVNIAKRKLEPRGYILFETTDELQRFLELLDGTAVADHRWQNFEWSDGVGSPLIETPPNGWKYGINVRRPGVKRDRIEIGASVRFPVGDVPLLELVLVALSDEFSARESVAQ